MLSNRHPEFEQPGAFVSSDHEQIAAAVFAIGEFEHRPFRIRERLAHLGVRHQADDEVRLGQAREVTEGVDNLRSQKRVVGGGEQYGVQLTGNF